MARSMAIDASRGSIPPAADLRTRMALYVSHFRIKRHIMLDHGGEVSYVLQPTMDSYAAGLAPVPVGERREDGQPG